MINYYGISCFPHEINNRRWWTKRIKKWGSFDKIIYNICSKPSKPFSLLYDILLFFDIKQSTSNLNFNGVPNFVLRYLGIHVLITLDEVQSRINIIYTLGVMLSILITRINVLCLVQSIKSRDNMLDIFGTIHYFFAISSYKNQLFVSF